MLLMQAQEIGVVLDEEQLLFIFEAFDSDVDEAPTAQTMFMENLSSADPIYDEVGPSYDSDILSKVQDHDNYLDSVGEYHEYVKDNVVQVVQSSVSSVPNDALMMIMNEMHEQAAQCVSVNEHNKVVNASLTVELVRYKEQVDLYEKRARSELTEREQKIDEQLRIRSALYNGHEIVKTNHATAVVHDSEDTLELAKITRKRMLEKVKSPLCVEKQIKIAPPYYSKENYLATFTPHRHLTPEQIFWSLDTQLSRFSEMHDAYTVEQSRCLELEAEIPKLKHKIQKDNHSEMIKRFSNLEIDHLNLKLKYQNLKEHFGNNKSQPSQDTPDFDTNERFRVENEKFKLHYKELYDSIKITHAKTIEKTTSLLTENEKLKAQLKGKMQCVTMPTVKPKVLTPGMYAIDVEPIFPCNRNNREVHLDYLKHLKESVETLREIVEEARIEKPLDNVLDNACFYTKRSQELLEYVIGTCPKEFNKRDKKAATTL
ncbi:hypothetical protein Tco_0535176 [Tanacetum coccineum]